MTEKLDPKTLRWCAEYINLVDERYGKDYYWPRWAIEEMIDHLKEKVIEITNQDKTTESEAEMGESSESVKRSNEDAIDHAKTLLEAEGYRVTLDDGQHVLSEDQAQQLNDWAEEFDIGCVDLGELVNMVSGWLEDARVSKDVGETVKSWAVQDAYDCWLCIGVYSEMFHSDPDHRKQFPDRHEAQQFASKYEGAEVVELEIREVGE